MTADFWLSLSDIQAAFAAEPFLYAVAFVLVVMYFSRGSGARSDRRALRIEVRQLKQRIETYGKTINELRTSLSTANTSRLTQTTQDPEEKHSFQPRYDETPPTPDNMKIIQDMADNMLQADRELTDYGMSAEMDLLRSKTYIGDVCVTCGKLVERPK